MSEQGLKAATEEVETSGAEMEAPTNAAEPTKAPKAKKESFFHKAFREMCESAKARHAVDKANFEAVKAESKANFEENRFENSLERAKAESKKSWDDAHMSAAERRQKEQEKRDAEIAAANARKAEAEKRTQKAKEVREKAKKNK